VSKESASQRQKQLRARLRQLILMRETGPKRAAWHEARMRLIWRLHDELRRAVEVEGEQPETPPSREDV
jgi:hypothetical protein